LVATPPKAEIDLSAAMESRCIVATRILVINNSENILALFQKILTTDDCQVFTQFFLNSDLTDVARIKPDLIILDYYVGREGVGWEFLQLLKMDEVTSKVPVLICTTAVKLAHDIAGYLATKQVWILRKPFERRDLVGTVDTIMHGNMDGSSDGTGKPTLSDRKGRVTS
jgi:DNA-binding response OmpR family regulator